MARTPYRVRETAGALGELIDGENAALVREIVEPIPNFWDIVDYGAQAGEIRYSKMIGWLLNPRENHGLGAFFAQRVVDAVYGEDAPTVSPRAKVHPREWRSIDVLLVDYDDRGDAVATLAIENKTDSVEHPRSGLGVSQTHWYRWIVEGDFASIREAIAAADVDAERKRWLLERVRRWEVETGDYRGVPDGGRRFVYLTPREGEVAEDPAFRTLTYGRLEELLAEAADALAETGGGDAEKIVRDFRRSIHRRFNLSLDRRIATLFAGTADNDGSSLAPELAGLAIRIGLIDDEHARRGDADYLADARDVERCVEDTRAAVNGVSSRSLSDVEFERLIAYVWDRRPARVSNDTSRFYWGGDRSRRLTKIQLLQTIAATFVKERDISTLAEFQRQFGAVVRTAVGTTGINPFVDGPVLFDPDTRAYSPSAAKRYRADETEMRDDMGAIELEGGRYRVDWRLGCRSDTAAGRLVHLPVIRAFVERESAERYPITDAPA